MGKVYFKIKGLKVTDKGFSSKKTSKNYSPSEMKQKITSETIVHKHILKGIGLFILACFIFSEATISNSRQPEWLAYFITVVLLLISYRCLFVSVIEVIFYLKNGKCYIVNFGSKKTANKFIDAMNKMFAEYNVSQKLATITS